MERFDAPWDRSLRISTGVVTVFLLAVPVALLAGPLRSLRLGQDGGTAWPVVLVPLVIALVLLAVWSLAPRAYQLGGGELVVVRPLFPVRVPLASVRGVSLVTRAQAGRWVKLAGSGGFFGHYGRFWSRGLGAFRLYATRRDQLVVVDTDAGRFVLTPSPPERFVEALGRAAPRAATGVGPAAAKGLPPGWWKALAAAVAAGLLLLGGLLLATAGRAPVGAVLEAEAIRIERRWVAPVRLPLAEVRSAAPLPADLTRGWWRVNGVGGPGSSRFGAYSSSGLGAFTLYAWRHGPYVLLETAGGRVVLTPDDPAAFVAEVEARLGR